MKIMCKLHRPNGTQVTLDGETYDFQPDHYGRHVCIVKNEKHQDVFLGIPEGYRPLIEDAEPAKVEGTVPAEAQTLAPTTPDDEDEDGEPEKEQEPEKEGEQEQGGEDEEIDLETLDDDALAKVYADVMGKKPHAKAKRETLIAHILEKAGS